MSARVLIVDDEAAIRSSLARLFAFEPWRLVVVADGAAALAALAGEEFAVALSDYHLPGMSGGELLRRIRERSPDTSRILFSGHVDVELIRAAVNAGEVYRFVTKPWNDDELLLAVRHGVERWQLLSRNRVLAVQAEEQNRLLRSFNAELEDKVAHRTADLELRNRALVLSQEVLDGLPVAVLGFAPDGQVALANALARELFPNLLPGEDPAPLPEPFRAWLAAATAGGAGAPLLLATALGTMRFETLQLAGRGVVVTAIPLGPAAALPLPAGRRQEAAP